MALVDLRKPENGNNNREVVLSENTFYRIHRFNGLITDYFAIEMQKKKVFLGKVGRAKVVDNSASRLPPFQLCALFRENLVAR